MGTDADSCDFRNADCDDTEPTTGSSNSGGSEWTLCDAHWAAYDAQQSAAYERRRRAEMGPWYPEFHADENYFADNAVAEVGR